MAHRKSPARIAKQGYAAQLRKQGSALAATGHWSGVDLAALELALVGRVVLPSSPCYDSARQESNPAFQSFPEIIVYCACENDVLECLAVARRFSAWVAVRCGGHSTGGYSVNSGMVIDLSELSGMVLDRPSQRVHVLPGTDFDHFNAAMNHTGWHVPSGACGSVCVGGFVQGGGYGYTSRAFGMQSDLVESMRVALADGTVVTANATENPRLFWALRGGTGGNFGVVLQVTYRMVPLDQVWAWSISWHTAYASQVLELMQRQFMRTGAPDTLGYMMNLGYLNQQPVAMVQGMFCGSEADGMQAIAPLLAIPTAQLLASQSGSYPDMNHWLEDNPYTLPDALPAGICETKASGYISEPMTQAQWQTVVDYFLTSPNAWTLAYLEPYGGAINRYPVKDSAFIHRNVDTDVVVDVFWRNEQERTQMEAWLDGFMALLRPYMNGHVYQNYPDSRLQNFAEAYWGSAYTGLQTVKAQYDPHDFFHYQQSIALPRRAD